MSLLGDVNDFIHVQRSLNLPRKKQRQPITDVSGEEILLFLTFLPLSITKLSLTFSGGTPAFQQKHCPIDTHP